MFLSQLHQYLGDKFMILSPDSIAKLNTCSLERFVAYLNSHSFYFFQLESIRSYLTDRYNHELTLEKIVIINKRISAARRQNLLSLSDQEELPSSSLNTPD